MAPIWDMLFETAAAQNGYFTTRQADEAGYSTQLLQKHIQAGRVGRSRRGIYRLVHYPAGEHEDLVVAWLWTDRAGVFSHHTALSLHELSDVMPAQAHLTVPEAWAHRRLRVPRGLVLHYADIVPELRTWFGPVPATTAGRALADCAEAGMSPELLRQAALQALRRGIVSRSELGAVDAALADFGGLR